MITVLLVLVAMVLGAIVNGWVLSIVWGWFVVPFGAPAIGTAWAIGIALTVSFVTYQADADSQKDGDGDFIDRVTVLIVHSFLRPLLVLLMGWIVHSFM